MGLDSPEQDSDGIGLVVVGRGKTLGVNCRDHGCLVGIALAGDEPLDRADRK